MSNELLLVLIGATGAAAIKVLGDVVQFILKRIAKKRDGKDAKEADLTDVVNELKDMKEILAKQTDNVLHQGNALRIFTFDRLDYIVTKFINEKSVPRGVRQDVDKLYKSYKTDLNANGDLKYKMEFFYKLPIREDMK